MPLKIVVHVGAVAALERADAQILRNGQRAEYVAPFGDQRDAEPRDRFRNHAGNDCVLPDERSRTASGTPPATAASIVDLPAPLGPMMQTNSPSPTLTRNSAQRREPAVADVNVFDFQHCRGVHAFSSTMLAEIGVNDRSIALNFLRRPLGDGAPGIEDVNAIADAHDDPHVMLDQQHPA